MATLEIAIVHLHQLARRRRRRSSALLAALLVGVLAGAGSAVWHWRPTLEVRSPVIEVRPAVPPPGGFAVPGNRMGEELANLLPSTVRAQVVTTSHGAFVDTGATDELPRRVQVGTVLLRSGEQVRVEVRRAPVGAPTWAATWSPTWSPTWSAGGPAGGEPVSRTALAVSRDGVEVRVELGPASGPGMIDEAQLVTIADAGVWSP